MKEIKFRAWNHAENKMYYRGYQKWLWVLLCEDDRGENAGRGRPVKRAPYGQCTLLESTGLFDIYHREIFEGDILRIRFGDLVVSELVGQVPDSFGSSTTHPLQEILTRHGIPPGALGLEFEVLGNEYENPELSMRRE